jgi:hypothetical protein
LQYVLQKCSIRSVTELTVRQARQMLAAWAAEQDAAGSRRDEVVRAAIDAGLRKSEVHRLTGHRADHDRPHRRYTPGQGTGPAMTAICAVCVAIARPYAPRIGGSARHDARLYSTADLPSRTNAVIPGPSRQRREMRC